MFDDPKTRQVPENQSTEDEGSAGGQAYQDMGETQVTETDLNQDTDTDDTEE
jgi:hypothetical protein